MCFSESSSPKSVKQPACLSEVGTRKHPTHWHSEHLETRLRDGFCACKRHDIHDIIPVDHLQRFSGLVLQDPFKLVMKDIGRPTSLLDGETSWRMLKKGIHL